MTTFGNVSFLLGSQSDHDNAVDSLDKMLNEVESDLSDAELKRPVHDENDVVSLEEVMKQLEKQKVKSIICEICLSIKKYELKRVGEGTTLTVWLELLTSEQVANINGKYLLRFNDSSTTLT